jgi:hypothetical protein
VEEVTMDYSHPTSLIPVAWLDDAQLRRELADLHRMERAVERHFEAGERRAFRKRLDELDDEYLRRFPSARSRWPWRLLEPIPEV